MSHLHIIIPSYNPPPGWEKVIAEKYRLFRESLQPEVTELTFNIVNDGSLKGISDGHITFLKDQIPSLNYFSYSLNKGKGYAVKEALAHIQGDYYIYTDTDFPYTPESLTRIFRELYSEKADVAIGVRDNEYYTNVPARRSLISKMLRWLLKNFMKLPVADTQCGLKGFNNAGKARLQATVINRFLFDMEFILRASKEKELRLVPVHVQLRRDIVFSKMNMKILLNELGNFIWLMYYSRFS